MGFRGLGFRALGCILNFGALDLALKAGPPGAVEQGKRAEAGRRGPKPTSPR